MIKQYKGLAHIYLDFLWKNTKFCCFKNRKKAYSWWNSLLNTKKEHISQLNETECKLLIKQCIGEAQRRLIPKRFYEYLLFCKFQAKNWEVRRKIYMPGVKR